MSTFAYALSKTINYLDVQMNVNNECRKSSKAWLDENKKTLETLEKETDAVRAYIDMVHTNAYFEGYARACLDIAEEMRDRMLEKTED